MRQEARYGNSAVSRWVKSGISRPAVGGPFFLVVVSTTGVSTNPLRQHIHASFSGWVRGASRGPHVPGAASLGAF